LSDAPKVFVSHASADKERFVLQFAARLREKGIDAWVDKWEMLPGDSLVDKIFEEGLKGATAVIVVLSEHSVQSKWVREELNASFVARIGRGTRIIPVILDNAPVPEALKATLWERIGDVSSYDENFERIVASIFGQTMKPALGQAPEYIARPFVQVGNLTAIDNLVLKLSCESAIENNNPVVDPNGIFNSNGEQSLPAGEVRDSIEILGGQGYFSVQWHSGGGGQFNCFYNVTSSGMEAYARAYLSNYDQLVNEVIVLLVNEGVESSEEIQKRLDQPHHLIRHVLTRLEERSLVNTETFLDGNMMIYGVSAALRRSLR